MILREVDVLHKADLSQIFLEFIERLPRQVIPTSGSLMCLLQECLGVSLVLNLKRHSSRVPHKPPVTFGGKTIHKLVRKCYFQTFLGNGLIYIYYYILYYILYIVFSNFQNSHQTCFDFTPRSCFFVQILHALFISKLFQKQLLAHSTYFFYL